VKIAFQGEMGAYSEMAARAYFTKPLTFAPYKEFAAVYSAVVKGAANFGILPIENSLTGSIHQVYDLLIKHRTEIVGEHKLRVCHNLLASRGSTLKSIRKVYSHPQALHQCKKLLKQLKVDPVPYFDTAGSAKLVAQSKDRTIAAIASAQAAQDFGLKTLKKDCEDNAQNFTRFIVLKKLGQAAPGGWVKRRAGVAYKTSIVFALKNIPGALYKCLSVFAIRDIDLLKIESRPIHGSPWKYLFYLDFKGHCRDQAQIRAIPHLQEITAFVKILGSYETAR
jgi:prephenate dehydratase